jgi:subtilisin family serine protease
MKRLLPLLLLAAYPAAAASSQRYIVTLRPVVNRPAARVLGDAAAVGRHAARDLGLINGFAAELTDDEVVALRRSKDVLSIDRVVERHLLDAAPHATSGPLSRTQAVPYGIDLVNAPEVWPLSRGANVNVVVIDTGVASHHPDLGVNIAGGSNAQGHTDDFADDNGHGTHVAGTIAAADNGLGVVGVAPEARVWSVKALDARGSGTNEDVIAAAAWVLAKKNELGGRWIVSMSFGSSESSPAEDEAFRRLRDADVLCVAAAGNSGFLALDYPAAYPSVLSVGAVDEAKTAAWFSSGGGTLGVMAPGVDVLSTLPVGSIANSSAQRGTARVAGMPFKQSARADATGAVVLCGYGGPGECGDAKGKIALITRGNGLYFAEKVLNAIADGAIAAIIVNSDDGPLFSGSLVRPVCDTPTTCVDSPEDLAYPWPPVTLVTKSDGEKLAKQLGPVALAVWDDDYGVKSGTSMAAPHVAGVAALLWSLAPSAHAIDIRRAIELTAHDLGPRGLDPANGNGLVDAAAAAKMLATAPEPPRRRSAGH